MKGTWNESKDAYDIVDSDVPIAEDILDEIPSNEHQEPTIYLGYLETECQ